MALFAPRQKLMAYSDNFENLESRLSKMPGNVLTLLPRLYFEPLSSSTHLLIAQ